MFWSGSRLPSISFDALVAATITGATLFVIRDAQLEGEGPLVGQTRAKQNTVEDAPGDAYFRLGESRAHYLVVDNFLSGQELKDAATGLSNKVFRGSQNEDDETNRGKRRVRNDQVCFLDSSEQDPGLSRVRDLLRALASKIETGNDNAWIGVPQMVQLSMYGDRNDGQASYYHAHVDGCSDTMMDLGLLGYLRSKYLRKRYVTAIVYLNEGEEWYKDRDGGCLRIYDGKHDLRTLTFDQELFDNGDFVDIVPKGGRLVMFLSQDILHSVQPTKRARYACTIWFTLNDS